MTQKMEILIIVSETADEQKRQEILQKLKKVITTKAGRFEKAEDWGMKRLAYSVDGHDKARYMLITYTTEASQRKELSKELETVCEKESEILRQMIMTIDEE